MMVTLDINGEIQKVEVRPIDTLLYVLRKQLSLTGAKPGCLNGDCGACSVNINNKVYKSCIFLVVEAIGKKITTIEGLKNTPIQEAFVKYNAFQCGYCTPGFIINCHTLLQNNPNPSFEVIKEWLSSNICRCTSYQEIEEAVMYVFNSRS